jgi:very-short-patch-repair endonuclease
VLRFRNEEVHHDLPGVVSRMAASASEQAQKRET